MERLLLVLVKKNFKFMHNANVGPLATDHNWRNQRRKALEIYPAPMGRKN